MGAFERLLKRWGYVKLERYGLSVGVDGRIRAANGIAVEAGAAGEYEVGGENPAPRRESPITWPGAQPGAPAQSAPPQQAPQSILQPPQSAAPIAPPAPPAQARVRGVTTPPPVPVFSPAAMLSRADAAATPTAPPAPAAPAANDAMSDEDEWEWQ